MHAKLAIAIKNITIIILILAIIIGGYFYNILNNKLNLAIKTNENFIAKKIPTKTITKIVYRDKILYQNDKITKRILFETSLFLASTNDNTTGLGQQYINSSGPDGTVGYENETEVVDPNTLLQAITKYNHDNKFDVKSY
jgi:hypothetical protein